MLISRNTIYRESKKKVFAESGNVTSLNVNILPKFWEMIERLKAIRYEEAPGGFDENPYSFDMALYHPTPVRLETPEARDQLIAMIRKTITITREENPWGIAES